VFSGISCAPRDGANLQRLWHQAKAGLRESRQSCDFRKPVTDCSHAHRPVLDLGRPRAYLTQAGNAARLSQGGLD